MTAECVVKALMSQWISRFGVPERITSDRGRQFESAIFQELISLIGTTHLRTTPYHPQSNGIIERWHRCLKSAILCHNSNKWVRYLPTILLGLRVAFKPDIGASPAELVYGTTLKIPGEFFNTTSPTEATSDAVADFRKSMEKLRPTETSHHSPPATFVSQELQSATHVFIRNDSIRPALTNPYDGPYKVTRKTPKYFTLIIRGRSSNISLDRLKPAFLAHLDTGTPTNISGPPPQQECNNNAPTKSTNVSGPPPQQECNNNAPTKSTRSGRQVKFPSRYV